MYNYLPLHIQDLQDKPSMFSNEISKDTMSHSRFTIYCTIDDPHKVLFNCIDEYYSENGKHPEMVLMGEDLYKSLLVYSFNELHCLKYERLMGVRLVLCEYIPKGECIAHGTAQEEFIRLLRKERDHE